jgi:hypothetical protein
VILVDEDGREQKLVLGGWDPFRAHR